MGSRRKARECALQMLFAADIAETPSDEVVRTYWAELGDAEFEEAVTKHVRRLLGQRYSPLRDAPIQKHC